MSKIKLLAIKFLLGYLVLIVALSLSAIILNLLCTQNAFKTSEIISMFWFDGLYFGYIKAINIHIAIVLLCLIIIIKTKKDEKNDIYINKHINDFYSL